VRFAFEKKQDRRMQQQTGHETNPSIRNCVSNEVYGLDVPSKQDRSKERNGIPKVPHSHTDNEKEENKFAPCLVFSLHDQD
jgi:hypothetical protein